MEALMGLDRYRWSSMSREDQIKEAAMAFIHLCAEQGADNPRQPRIPPQLDPYIRASVASMPKPRLPATIRNIQAEPVLQLEIPEEFCVARKPVMKRKVLRRRPDGEVQVTDESVISEPDSVSPSDPEYRDLGQRMFKLNIRPETEESEEECELTSSPESEIPYSWKTSESRSSASSKQDLIMSGHPKSFILPRLDQLSQNRMKTDRVARYLEHKHDWESLRLPGEDHRKGVRWSIREQMLYKTEFPARARPVFSPNNYLVPTEKKRSALRWGIRCDLAKGVIPKNSYSS
ncbi:centriolar and ciliogenesis-associated protein HYLS1 [Tiliqua scincoides]|uniref:centriolar and ciliogenesis-associated protein HYLS1 n=1 Tax=Tiliqua scincoides TaxID=71010 RepID=UPI003461E4AA